jgi:ParB-like chromosome segregation protein Spo0J
MNKSDKHEILCRATNATTRRTKVRLDELKFDLARYCHRDEEALKEENLAPLMQSLILEGQLVPIEFFTNAEGEKELLGGHRRVTALRTLADKNVPRFTRDMEVEANEVLDATPQDLLVLSIADNAVRQDLGRDERIRVSKKLHDAGVQVERAARAMGVSVKTYERDLLIARHGWMFQHVIDKSIEPSNAIELLTEAEKAGRVNELKEDLGSWVAKQKETIRQKEKLRKAKEGKELRPAEKEVKRLMPKHLVAHWLELLRSKKRLDEDAEQTYAAGIDSESEQLHISAVTLHLARAPLGVLAEVASKLSQLSKQLAPYLKKRHEQEKGGKTSQEAAAAYDYDYLQNLGLDDVAKELEERAQQAQQPDGEADPGRDQQPARPEQDLSAEVQLPPATVTTPAPEPPAPAPAEEGKKGQEPK